jgi:ComF family protein
MGFPDIRDVWRGLLELVFPNSCLICDMPQGEADHFSHGLCPICLKSVEADPLPSCSRCAATIGPHADTTEGCVVCRNHRFEFDATIRLGPYDGRLKEAVIRQKFSTGEGLAEMMGRILADTARPRLEEQSASVVIPVPMHWRRRWLRGHNQAAELARGIASGLGIPFASVLRRVRHTPQQVQPSATARRENVKGAFRVKSGARLSGRCVLLVDDVMTTGSTLSEAARVLKASGASRVAAVVQARR